MKRYKKMDEKTIVEKSINNDKKALQELFLRSKKDIELLLKSLEPDTSFLYDMMQDVFYKVGKNIKFLSNPMAYKKWLNKIIHNTWKDYRKKEEVIERIIKPESDYFSEQIELTALDKKRPQEVVLEEEMRDKLHGAVMRLPKEYRVVILLRDYANLNYEDISEILNINIGTIKSRISRGREKLKEQMQKYI